MFFRKVHIDQVDLITAPVERLARYLPTWKRVWATVSARRGPGEATMPVEPPLARRGARRREPTW